MPYTARHPISDMTCMTQKADAALPLVLIIIPRKVLCYSGPGVQMIPREDH